MSGRIFAKFDIAPKAQLWSEHFETCSVKYEYMILQIVYLGFVISLTSGQVNFVTCPLYQVNEGRNKYGKYLSDRFKSLRMIMNMAKDDIPV